MENNKITNYSDLVAYLKEYKIIKDDYILNEKDLLLFINKFLEHITVSNNKV